MSKKKEVTLSDEIKLAISEKIEVLKELCVIQSEDSAAIYRRMEETIISQPDRDPVQIIDAIGRDLMDKYYSTLEP